MVPPRLRQRTFIVVANSHGGLAWIAAGTARRATARPCRDELKHLHRVGLDELERVQRLRLVIQRR